MTARFSLISPKTRSHGLRLQCVARAQHRKGLLQNLQFGPIQRITERAFTLPRKLRGCSWTSRKDPPLGAAIALAQDSFDRDKTR